MKTLNQYLNTSKYSKEFKELDSDTFNMGTLYKSGIPENTLDNNDLVDHHPFGDTAHYKISVVFEAIIKDLSIEELDQIVQNLVYATFEIDNMTEGAKLVHIYEEIKDIEYTNKLDIDRFKNFLNPYLLVSEKVSVDRMVKDFYSWRKGSAKEFDDFIANISNAIKATNNLKDYINNGKYGSEFVELEAYIYSSMPSRALHIHTDLDEFMEELLSELKTKTSISLKEIPTENSINSITLHFFHCDLNIYQFKIVKETAKSFVLERGKPFYKSCKLHSPDGDIIPFYKYTFKIPKEDLGKDLALNDFIYLSNLGKKKFDFYTQEFVDTLLSNFELFEKWYSFEKDIVKEYIFKENGEEQKKINDLKKQISNLETEFLNLPIISNEELLKQTDIFQTKETKEKGYRSDFASDCMNNLLNHDRRVEIIDDRTHLLNKIGRLEAEAAQDFTQDEKAFLVEFFDTFYDKESKKLFGNQGVRSRLSLFEKEEFYTNVEPLSF